MQWAPEYGNKGRLVEERSFPVVPPPSPSELSSVTTSDTASESKYSKKLRHSVSRYRILAKCFSRVVEQGTRSEPESRPKSWLPSSLTFDTALKFRERCDSARASVPLPGGSGVPSPMFARKHSMLDGATALPPDMAVCQMPTAELKATDTIVDAAFTGLLENGSKWRFCGPFTPQLGFDGGLDFKWACGSEITIKRFDREADLEGEAVIPIYPPPESVSAPLACSISYNADETRIEGLNDGHAKKQLRSKRKGMIFDRAASADFQDEKLLPVSFDAAGENSSRERRPYQNATPGGVYRHAAEAASPCQGCFSRGKINAGTLPGSSAADTHDPR